MLRIQELGLQIPTTRRPAFDYETRGKSGRMGVVFFSQYAQTLMQLLQTLMRKAYSIYTVVHTLITKLHTLMTEAISSFTIVHTLITEPHTLMGVAIC